MKHCYAMIIIFLFLVSLNVVAHAKDDHYARGLVIQALEPNPLGVGGAEFRTMANAKGNGVLVYDPRTRFNGVKRNLIWLVVEDEAYPLNGASKNLTPSLKWPREADTNIWKSTGLNPFQSKEAIEAVFGSK